MVARLKVLDSTDVARELAPKIALATGRSDKQEDIEWAVKELLGNIRHSPVEVGYAEVDDCGNLTITNCAVGDGQTLADKHGLGFKIARSLGAIVELRFIKRNYGCWQAITIIRWDFDVEPVAIDLSDCTF